MTGPKGDCVLFPREPECSRGEAEGDIEVDGKQNSLYPTGAVIKMFCYTPNSKIEK